MSDLSISFYGVRGSRPAPGWHTRDVGGHTSCIEIRTGDTRIILDAGTGLVPLGERLSVQEPGHVTLLLSHLHWDHVQGLPYFRPLHTRGYAIDVVSGPCGSMSLRRALEYLMSAPFFPIGIDRVASQLSARELRVGRRFRVGSAVVSSAALNHRDPACAYRIDACGRSIVYATDTEHYSCVDPALARLAEGADLLIYDTQFTPEEYRGDDGPPRVGWGHSTYEAGAQLAEAAGVGRLVLFHHDPDREDDGVRMIERRAQQLFTPVVAAREGMTIRVGEATTRATDEVETAA